jgi:predicted nucleic acid-binding protein
LKKYFIDTSFVIALVNQNDEYHSRALELTDNLAGFRFVTSDLVLYEIANYLAKDFKAEAIKIINTFLNSTDIEIIWHAKGLFTSAFNKYTIYSDKKWGLVDCLSFVIMENLGIHEALTIDHHFEQAGFQLLT